MGLFKCILFSVLIITSASAKAVVELGAEYSISKLKYGTMKSSSQKDSTYSGSMAIYFWDYTALEFNYSQGERVTEEGRSTQISATETVTGWSNTLETTVYGVGIRQAFAGRKAYFRPVVSIGYAKQIFKDRTRWTLLNDDTGESRTISSATSESNVDSVFATFMLQMRLTKTFSLKASVKSVFPAFETERMGDNVRYSLGFTWFL